MVKQTLYLILFCCLLLFANHSRAQLPDVLTQHNDYNRTGWNPLETILNQSNVTPTNFGLLYKRSVDDQIFAQPLYVSGVTVTDPVTHAVVVRNVVYIATVNNSVYAFDADDGTMDPYWQLNFTPSGEVVPSAIDIHPSLCYYTYTDFQGVAGLGQNGNFGIVGTPVIDKSTNTIYFVSRYRDPVVDNAAQFSDPAHSVDQGWSSGGFFQVVHALDLSTGANKFGSPVLIDPATTTVNGTGPGHDINNQIHFDCRRNNQRGGLLLSNGIVYIPYAGHCDMDDYHGWILGYSASDLSQQKIRYTTTPNDERGGIWMSGAGLAGDASGNIYFANGNANDASLASSPQNVGLSIVKVAPDLVNHTLSNVSWFKPASYHDFNTSDLDFATGVILIPGINMLVTAHKSGKLYAIKQLASPAGEFNESSPNVLGIYDLGVGSSAQGHSSLTYFGGSPTPYIYQFSEYTHLTAYPVNTGSQTLGTPLVNFSVPTNPILEGGFSSVSSNGSMTGSGILWVTHYTGPGGGTMHAVKADDVTQELWNSDMNVTDLLGHYAKMSAPTIANGKVYAPTFSNSLNVYGLLSSNTRCITNLALNKPVFASVNTDINNPASGAVDGNTGTRWGSTFKPNYIYVDLGARYDICKVSIQWHKATPITDYGADFTVDISDDATNWTTINAVTGNIFTADPGINTFNEHSTGRYVRVNITRNSNTGQPPVESPYISISELQVFGSPANSCIAPAVVNMNASSITQNSATLNWNPVSGVTNYLIRYKGPTVSSYITRTLQDLSGSGNTLSLPISALTCGFNYEFQIQSDCGSGKMSAPATQLFTTLGCSSPCLNLTRYAHGDLGDIKAAGMSCYAAPTFTVTGAGNGIGGVSDQFQFNYTSLDKDEEFIMHIASQDQTFPASQAGIMMRDSVTDISRFIFMGKTGDNQLSMIYRNTNGGSAVSLLLPNTGNANYFRIVKSNILYSAFYGNSLTGPWTQMGSTQNLHFGGNNNLYIGMAVSSLNATTPSSANFDNLQEGSTPLPILLIDFTASNVNDEFVSLNWMTSIEVNSDHFDVERSSDATSFTKIATIKADGTNNTNQSYHAIDDKPVNGLNFYRLKQVDIDGHFTYSSVKTIKFGSRISPVVYPNPVSSVFTAVPGTELIREIVIYNVQGKAVQFAMGNSTDTEMKVNISRLSQGIYYLKVKTDSKIFQFKILKE